MKEQRISIWFLIGLQLSLYGVLIVGAGIYQFYFPSIAPPVLENLHPAIWWGAIMLGLGLFYSIAFRPRK